MNEKVNALIQKPWVIPTSVGVAGFSVGCVVGYLWTKRRYDQIESEIARIETRINETEDEVVRNQMRLDFNAATLEHIRYNELADRYVTVSADDPDDESVEDIPETHFGALMNENPNRPIGKIVEITEDAVGIEVKYKLDEDVLDAVKADEAERESRFTGMTIIRDIPTGDNRNIEADKNQLIADAFGLDVEEVENAHTHTQNVFDNDDVWDWEAELSTRSPDIPYVIHVEEWETNEVGLEQITLTYYMGDDIVTDDHDVPVYRPDNVIGKGVRDLFGHGSQDKNVVYIRNETNGCEYEILKDNGSYEVEVIGLAVENAMADEDIRHSRHRVLKFKED